MELFTSNDFARTRPHQHKEGPAFDFILAAREEGANIVQDFHEGLSVRGGQRYAIIADACAFANGNGGTLHIGLSEDPKKPVVGVQDVEHAIRQLEQEMNNRISPPLKCTIDVHETAGKKVVRILVPRGDDPPYAVDENKIYVRSEAETALAVRDEIVGLVKRSLSQHGVTSLPAELHPVVESHPQIVPATAELEAEPPPRTGVEVVAVEERESGRYFTMRDLRNGNMVKNVTQSSARRLWHYAITRFSHYPADLSQAGIQWQGNLGLVTSYQQGKSIRYDLVQRAPQGSRYYFGVTEDGIHGPWADLVGQEDE